MSRFCRFVAFVLAAGCAGAAGLAQETVSANLDRYVEARSEVDGFQGAVLVARDGQTLLERGVGYADLESREPNRPWTRFRLGSITKSFTAMAILILKEQGKLALDDPVSKHWPEAPEAWSKVTIRHLLTHTSGIPSFTGFPDYVPRMREATTPAKTIARFRDKPLEFEPGSKFAYSNSGYVLLGAIVEKLSGMSYAEFVKAQIFDPLGMSHTAYDDTRAVVPFRASGYALDTATEELRNAEFLDMSIPHAAGGLASTIGDLERWDRALREGKLISAESYKELYQPLHNDYALGWIVQDRDGKRRIGHGGGINGFSTQLTRYPDEKLVVVVLSNVESGLVGRVAEDLAKIAMGESVELPRARRTVELSAEALEPLVGKYQVAPGVVFEVKREGDRLLGQLAGRPVVRLHATGPREFFVKEADATVEFAEPKDGVAPALVLKQGGRVTEAKRIDSEAKGDGEGTP